jgi:hypothetical protein
MIKDILAGIVLMLPWILGVIIIVYGWWVFFRIPKINKKIVTKKIK